MKKKLIIREYEESDFKDLVRLSHKNHNWIVSLDKDNLTGKMIDKGIIFVKDLVKSVYKNRGKIIMVFINEKVAGTGAAKIPDSKDNPKYKKVRIGEISNVFVEEKFRSQGIGREIVAELEGFLKKAGCKFIRLVVFTPNIKAYNFYQELGYKDRSYNLIKKT